MNSPKIITRVEKVGGGKKNSFPLKPEIVEILSEKFIISDKATEYNPEPEKDKINILFEFSDFPKINIYNDLPTINPPPSQYLKALLIWRDHCSVVDYFIMVKKNGVDEVKEVYKLTLKDTYQM